MEKNIILIDLKENLNNLDYPFLLVITPRDIELLAKIEDIVMKHYKRPWVYFGLGETGEPNPELLKEIDDIDADLEEKERIKRLVTQIKLPVELVIVLRGGDKNEFHNHISDVSSNFQLEQYIVPENKEIVLEIQRDDDTHKIRIKGPSVLVVGPENHRRAEGGCFVIKFPPGNYKCFKP